MECFPGCASENIGDSVVFEAKKNVHVRRLHNARHNRVAHAPARYIALQKLCCRNEGQRREEEVLLMLVEHLCKVVFILNEVI